MITTILVIYCYYSVEINNSTVFNQITKMIFFLLKLMSFILRLPVAQGSAFSFFPPIIALMSSESWQCPAEHAMDNITGNV